MKSAHHTPAKQLQSDRRSCTRIVAALPVGFKIPPNQGEPLVSSPLFSAETLDIGMGGISCNAMIDDTSLAKELAGSKRPIDLNIKLVDRSREFHTAADLAWIYNLKGLSVQTKFRVGFGFLNLKKADHDSLSSYLQDMIAEQRQRNAEARERIKEILSKIAKIDEHAFSEETRIREELKVDSLMAMETLAIVETIYDIEIDVDRVIDVVTVGDMMDLIQGYIQRKAHRA